MKTLQILRILKGKIDCIDTDLGVRCTITDDKGVSAQYYFPAKYFKGFSDKDRFELVEYKTYKFRKIK